MAIVSCVWKIENACHSSYELWITSWAISHCFLFLENVIFFFPFLGIPRK